MENIEKNFSPTVEWMSKKYDEMNTSLFNGRLGTCSFGIFTTGRGSGGSVLGWFRITGDHIKAEKRGGRMFKETYVNRIYINKDNFVDLCKPKIELNGNYTGTEHGFLATLVHEMCHYYTYMDGWMPKQAHGTEFRNIGYVVSQRSNGMFTIKRLATAEDMSELELSDEMKVKKEKRLKNKKASVYAVIVFKRNGQIELTITSNQEVIDQIRKHYQIENERNIVVNNDEDVIELLFSKGYRRNMRTWRYWNIENVPWIEELKNLLKPEENNNIEEPEQKQEPEIKNLMFSIKTTNGDVFEYRYTTFGDLKRAVKKKFPKISDEALDKILSNPANYKVMENKKSIKQIIKEVVDEVLAREINSMNSVDDSVEISPKMNLGKYSPLEKNIN